MNIDKLMEGMEQPILRDILGNRLFIGDNIVIGLKRNYGQINLIKDQILEFYKGEKIRTLKNGLKFPNEVLCINKLLSKQETDQAKQENQKFNEEKLQAKQTKIIYKWSCAFWINNNTKEYGLTLIIIKSRPGKNIINKDIEDTFNFYQNKYNNYTFFIADKSFDFQPINQSTKLTNIFLFNNQSYIFTNEFIKIAYFCHQKKELCFIKIWKPEKSNPIYTKYIQFHKSSYYIWSKTGIYHHINIEKELPLNLIYFYFDWDNIIQNQNDFDILLKTYYIKYNNKSTYQSYLEQTEHKILFEIFQPCYRIDKYKFNYKQTSSNSNNSYDMYEIYIPFFNKKILNVIQKNI